MAVPADESRLRCRDPKGAAAGLREEKGDAAPAGLSRLGVMEVARPSLRGVGQIVGPTVEVCGWSAAPADLRCDRWLCAPAEPIERPSSFPLVDRARSVWCASHADELVARRCNRDQGRLAHRQPQAADLQHVRRLGRRPPPACQRGRLCRWSARRGLRRSPSQPSDFGFSSWSKVVEASGCSGHPSGGTMTPAGKSRHAQRSAASSSSRRPARRSAGSR